MIGYVGERAKRRKRKSLFIFFLIVFLFIIIFIYYNYNINSKKIISKNKIIVNNANINTQESNASIEDYKLKLFEKDQKITLRDQRLLSLNREINILKNDNKKLLDTLNLLNSEMKIEFNKNNSIVKKNQDIAKKEIEQLNFIIIKDHEEKQKINKEYKIIANQNLKLILQLKSLEQNIVELKKLIAEQKKTIIEKEKIVKDLKDKIHH